MLFKESDRFTVKDIIQLFSGLEADTEIVIGYGSKILVFQSQDGKKVHVVPKVESYEEWRKRLGLS